MSTCFCSIDLSAWSELPIRELRLFCRDMGVFGWQLLDREGLLEALLVLARYGLI